jgi:hypothetical protein
MHHYLVVANRTLGGPQLLDVIRNRLARGPAAFWVLAPATPNTHLINDFNALSCAFPVDPTVLPGVADIAAGEHWVREAQERLDAELRRLHSLGATAAGVVGDRDPLKAIDTVLAERAFDEIILSTLPPGVSRWLAWDLPHRIRRRTDIPLTVVTSRDDASESERLPPQSRPPAR